MKKREFIKTGSVLTLGALLAPNISCSQTAASNPPILPVSGAFSLPDLAFNFDALEPHIDAKTMEIHHGKHHAGYVSKLNDAIKDSPLANQSLEESLAGISENDLAVRNNGGGHYNHTLFWQNLSPAGGLPEGKLLSSLETSFGGYDNFKTQFADAAKSRFGSGWAWLCQSGDGALFISSTPNQDNPLMKGLVENPGNPLLGLDVWEHAYYLNYQNRRADYIESFFSIINWSAVSKRLN